MLPSSRVLPWGPLMGTSCSVGSSLLVWSSFFHSPGSRLTPHHYNTYTICLAHLHLHLHAAVIIDLPSIIAYIHASCHHKSSRTYKHTQPKVSHLTYFYFSSSFRLLHPTSISRYFLVPVSILVLSIQLHPLHSVIVCCLSPLLQTCFVASLPPRLISSSCFTPFPSYPRTSSSYLNHLSSSITIAFPTFLHRSPSPFYPFPSIPSPLHHPPSIDSISRPLSSHLSWSMHL